MTARLAALLFIATACWPSSEPDPLLLEAIDLYTGVAGVVDNDSARTLLLAAAEDEDPLSTMWIARVHSTGRMGFPRDPVQAYSVASGVIEQVERMALGGQPEAMFLMGTAYAEGLGKEEDPVLAASWYRRAAEEDHVLALHNLGNIYRDGIGVEQNDTLALVWWTQAAQRGDAIPALRLGEFYEAGRGTAPNVPEAVRWYTQAAQRGNAEAQAALERLRP